MTSDLTVVDGLAQVAFLVHGTLERRASEHGMSIVQMRLLGILRDRTPTINELAALLELEKSSVSGLIDRAERRGLVERRRVAEDGRSVRVALTGEGRALAAEVAGRFGDDVAELLSSVSPADRAALARIVSGLLVREAAARGIDLFAGTDGAA